jgi:membrane associated rhomboid family serine protease
MGLLLTPAQHMAASLALDVAAPPPGVGVWAHAAGAAFGALAAVLWRGR